MKKRHSGAGKSGSSDIVLLMILVLILGVSLYFKNELNSLRKETEELRRYSAEQAENIRSLRDKEEINRFYTDSLYDMCCDENSLRLAMEGIIPRDIPEFDMALPADGGFDSEEKKHAFEYNIKRMQSIYDFGNIAAEYISPEDNRAERYIIMSAVKKLSDEICANSASDLDKAGAIAVWVTDNIYYDNDAGTGSVTPDTISIKNTLALKRTVCSGYSNLFSALCQAQGIVCININGTDMHITDDGRPNKHEWNAAFCGGEWVFYDTAWASNNYYSDGEYSHSEKINDKYLGMDFKAMSSARKADIAEFRNFYAALFDDK